MRKNLVERDSFSIVLRNAACAASVIASASSSIITFNHKRFFNGKLGIDLSSIIRYQNKVDKNVAKYVQVKEKTKTQFQASESSLSKNSNHPHISVNDKF